MDVSSGNSFGRFLRLRTGAVTDSSLSFFCFLKTRASSEMFFMKTIILQINPLTVLQTEQEACREHNRMNTPVVRNEMFIVPRSVLGVRIVIQRKIGINALVYSRIDVVPSFAEDVHQVVRDGKVEREEGTNAHFRSCREPYAKPRCRLHAI